jgi:Inositol phosphatase
LVPGVLSILLQTDRAIYGCKFDWSTEKVASFERIGLGSISKIHYGTYVTSKLSEGQMVEELNIDLVISYAPGGGSIQRVNTRSLQVSAEGDKDEAEANIGDGAGANRE